MQNIETLSNRVKEYLDSQEWHYSFDNEKRMFKFGMGTKTKMKNIDIIIKIRENSIIAYGMPRISADTETMSVAVEYIARANYGLVIGNFEIDCSDGELRYKSSIYCKDDVPSLDVVKYIVELPILMWKIYGDGLLACLFAGSSPEEEIKKLEMNSGHMCNPSSPRDNPLQ